MLNCANLQPFYKKPLNHQRFDLAHLICTDLSSFRKAKASVAQSTNEASQLCFELHFPIALLHFLSKCHRESRYCFFHTKDVKIPAQEDHVICQGYHGVRVWINGLMPLQDAIVACTPTAGKNKDADRTGRPCGFPLACSDSCEY